VTYYCWAPSQKEAFNRASFKFRIRKKIRDKEPSERTHPIQEFKLNDTEQLAGEEPPIFGKIWVSYRGWWDNASIEKGYVTVA
jgi:hypothetical protein